MDLERVALEPTLQFEVIDGEIPLDTCWSFNDFDYNAVHRKLVASDSWNVWCIDPIDGTHRILCQTDVRHSISCTHPGTGDVVLACPKLSLTADHDFFRLEISTGMLSEIDLTRHREEMHAHLDASDVGILRLVFMADGGKYFWIDDLDEDDDDVVAHVVHFDSSDQYVDMRPTYCCCNGSSHLESLLGDSLYIRGPANQDGIFGTIGNCIAAYFFETQEPSILAGSLTSGGCANGIGGCARFWNLMTPAVNSSYLFVRAEGAKRSQWRFVCLDLKTCRVQSARIIGLSHDEILNYCLNEEDMFAVRSCRSSTEGYKVQLLRAPLNFGSSAREFLAAIASVDLAAPGQPVTFHLADGASLQLDRRLLAARSEYFRGMFNSGLREDCMSAVDLTSDSDADEASLSVLIRFILSDTWHGPHDDAELAFRVRALADRYQFSKLLRIAEAHLHGLLTSATVLAFLGRVVDSGGPLEEACWSLMDSEGSAIIESHEENLDAIIALYPKLAKRLIQRGFSC